MPLDQSLTKNVVFTVQVNVSEYQLRSFLPYLNEYVDEDEDEQPITYEEVINNKKMLEYVCSEAVEDGSALYDPAEFWNEDGWSNILDYR